MPLELAEIGLFRGVSASDLAAADGAFTVETVSRGVDLISERDRGDVVYLLLEGTCKAYALVGADEVVLAILGPGDLVGELSVIDSLGRSASVRTLQECTVARVGAETFWRWVESVPPVARNLLELVSRRLRMANATRQALAALDVSGRVCYELLVLAREYGEPVEGGILIPLRLTQDDFAGLVGATRVRVNQVLGELRRTGALTTDRSHRLTIVDREALARQALLS